MFSPLTSTYSKTQLDRVFFVFRSCWSNRSRQCAPKASRGKVRKRSTRPSRCRAMPCQPGPVNHAIAVRTNPISSAMSPKHSPQAAPPLCQVQPRKLICSIRLRFVGFCRLLIFSSTSPPIKNKGREAHAPRPLFKGVLFVSFF
jgi:hypothetical protein